MNTCVQEYIGERNSLQERHGNGWAYLPNGDQYHGQYRRGHRHGSGLYVFKNGARYLGMWRCSLKSGLGTFYYPDGSTYTGEWKKDLRHGYGTYIYQNCDKYEGSWHKGHRHGVGLYTFKDTSCVFNGTWNKGVRIGPAEIIFPKHRFHGTWYDQDPMGPAVYTFACKTMATGYIKLIPIEIQTNLESDIIVADEKTDEKPDEVKKLSVVATRNVAGEKRLYESVWHSQCITKYNFAKLPPEPMPQPLSDSEDDECEVTPEGSEAEIIDFLPMREEDEEDDFLHEPIEEEEEVEVEAV